MAIAIALPGFKHPGRLVTPISPLTDQFPYRFSRQKNENLSIGRLNFWRNALTNFLLYSSPLISEAVLIAS